VRGADETASPTKSPTRHQEHQGTQFAQARFLVSLAPFLVVLVGVLFLSVLHGSAGKVLQGPPLGPESRFDPPMIPACLMAPIQQEAIDP